MVIGLDNTGWLDTLAAVVLVMVNLGMQLAFSGRKTRMDVPALWCL